MNWYYYSEGREVGPLSDSALAEIHASGGIADETPVRREDSAEWEVFSTAFFNNAEQRQEPAPSPNKPLFKFECPHCQQHISADEDYSGKTVQCPACGGEFVVPSSKPKDPRVQPVLKRESKDKTSQVEATSRKVSKRSKYMKWSATLLITCLTAAWALHGFLTRPKDHVAKNIGLGEKMRVIDHKNGLESSAQADDNPANPVIQFMTGLSYYYGESGKVKNYKEAVKWFRNSADQGYDLAQLFLGQCYYLGEGVEKDQRSAAEWYYKSAIQGNSEAQFGLGLCLLVGSGVKQDEKAAYMWFNLSCNTKDESVRNKARAFMGEAEKKITDSDLAEAQRASKKWRPGDESYGKPIFQELEPVKIAADLEKSVQKDSNESKKEMPWESPPYSLTKVDGKESIAEQWLRESKSTVNSLFTEISFGMTLEEFEAKYRKAGSRKLEKVVKKNRLNQELISLKENGTSGGKWEKRYVFQAGKLVSYQYRLTEKFGVGAEESVATMRRAEETRELFKKQICEMLPKSALGIKYTYSTNDQPHEVVEVSFADSMGSMESHRVTGIRKTVDAGASLNLVSRDYIAEQLIPRLDWYVDEIGIAIEKGETRKTIINGYDENIFSPPISFYHVEDYDFRVDHNVLYRALIGCLIKKLGGIDNSVRRGLDQNGMPKISFLTKDKVEVTVDIFHFVTYKKSEPLDLSSKSTSSEKLEKSLPDNSEGDAPKPLQALNAFKQITIEEAKECIRLLDGELSKDPTNERIRSVKSAIMDVFRSEASLVAAKNGANDADKEYRIKMQNLQIASRPSPLTGKVNTAEVERIRGEAENIKSGSTLRVNNAKSELKTAIDNAKRTITAPDREPLSRVWDQIERRNNL